MNELLASQLAAAGALGWAVRHLATGATPPAAWAGMAMLTVAAAMSVLAALVGSRGWAWAASWAWTLGSLPVLAWGRASALEAAAVAGLLVLHWETGELYALVRMARVSGAGVRRALILAAARAVGCAAAGASLARLTAGDRVAVAWPLYLLAAAAVAIGLRIGLGDGDGRS